MIECSHALVVDEDARDTYSDHVESCAFYAINCRCRACDELTVARDQDPAHMARRCLFCGVAYDRTAFLKKLERAIRDRYRLPSLTELVDDPWHRDYEEEDD